MSETDFNISQKPLLYLLQGMSVEPNPILTNLIQWQRKWQCMMTIGLQWERTLENHPTQPSSSFRKWEYPIKLIFCPLVRFGMNTTNSTSILFTLTSPCRRLPIKPNQTLTSLKKTLVFEFILYSQTMTHGINIQKGFLTSTPFSARGEWQRMKSYRS